MSRTRSLPRRPRDHSAGGGLGAFLFFAIVAVLWWQCGSLERMTADATVANGELWVYASDVAPGQSFEGRVRLRGGAKLAITAVSVRSFGSEDTLVRVLDRPVRWGDSVEVTTKTYRGGLKVIDEDGEDEVGFRIPVPPSVQPGRVLALEVEVDYTVAAVMGQRIEPEDRVAHFQTPVAVHGPAASVARRIGKGVAALALVATMVVLPVIARRRQLGGLGIALVTIAFGGGWPAMAFLAGHALRMHGAWWWLACALITLTCAVLGVWWTRGDRFARYRLIPIRIAGAPGDAYRAGAPPLPPRTTTDLEQAWLADGLAVYRKDDEVVVLGAGEARVPIADDPVDGDAPLELRCERPELVERLARAAASVLGEVRIELVDERKRGQD